MLSRGLCSCSCIENVTRRGNEGKGVHSEGKDEERVVTIPRFQGGSPRLCQLRTVLLWSRWQALICTGHMSGFIGHGKPSSPGTTLSNRPSLL
jgi:hypothetical protein